ncbi:Hsp20/alpha crystallin family protein [Nocardiopsis exhalans]|uniref:HSP20 family protein n=2 Tax=Nocardiopsis TaxID=2013 RepID=A0A840WQR6_9ACTN|nr:MULTISPECIES: Hsp20/alpha crystallin family protein [Nocardiopsis]MBB5492468.1 HSP20 family protein [Nocardiopsis metallicus]USY18896.1 Hsp20/alpha crystallin family protein [Nocardiopsis exhalans]
MTPKRFSNPFHGVVDMITEMNRISDTMSSIETSQAGERERGFADAWSPPTDILARGRDLVIRCEVPGVYEEDVSVSLNHGILTISGERRRDEDDVVYYSSERFMGTFRREISLPDGVGEKDVEASYGEGLLEVVVHGAANQRVPKRINISRRKRT